MSQHLKKPLFQTLGQTIQSRIADAAQLDGKALPCRVLAVTGAFVTVAFELVTDFTLPLVTLPIATSRYIRAPIQPGDTGLAIPADALLGGVTGESGVTATLMKPANLGALVFLPLGNVAFTMTDPLSVELAGPNGVILRNTAGTESVTISALGVSIESATAISITCGTQSITLTPAAINITGALFVNGNPYPT